MSNEADASRYQSFLHKQRSQRGRRNQVDATVSLLLILPHTQSQYQKGHQGRRRLCQHRHPGPERGPLHTLTPQRRPHISIPFQPFAFSNLRKRTVITLSAQNKERLALEFLGEEGSNLVAVTCSMNGRPHLLSLPSKDCWAFAASLVASRNPSSGLSFLTMAPSMMSRFHSSARPCVVWSIVAMSGTIQTVLLPDCDVLALSPRMMVAP